jgi:hypothetical protein
MNTLEDRGSLLRKLVAISVLLSAVAVGATAPSTIPYASTIPSADLTPSEAEVRIAIEEIQAARLLIARGGLYADFDAYLGAVERALDVYDSAAGPEQQRLLRLANSLALARASLQEGTESLAAWVTVAAILNPHEEYLRLPERFVVRGEVASGRETTITSDDVTTWLDLDHLA